MFLMIQFSLFMMTFCVIYTNLENMLKLISLNLTIQISQSAPAHQLETVKCHLILHFIFTCCIVKHLSVIITIP